MAPPRTTKLPSGNPDAIVFAACEQGDLQNLKVHLDPLSASEIGAIRDGHKATLAHYAARYGHIPILEYLIDKKHLDISQLRTENGATCAHDAAVCDQIQTLYYIFTQQKKHADQPIFTEKLHWAIRDGHGNTLLHLAAAYGSVRTVQYLLERESADPRVRSYNSFQPIHYAASSGHEATVKLLSSRAPDTVNEQTNTLLTPIYLACQHGSMETVKVLASHGGNFKLRDENGLNCLHVACQNAHLEIVQWLVTKQNADVNDVDYTNHTALHYAAAGGKETLLIYLLDTGARITQSSSGNTPLHVAAENGHQGACAVLLERGACSVNTRNNARLTASECAFRYGFNSLANELRLRSDQSFSSDASSKGSDRIRLENATVVRLVVKRRHVTRTDAANQVAEDDLMPDSDGNNLSISSDNIVNSRFDLSELRQQVERHDARRRETSSSDVQSNRLMHSMDSLNQHERHRQRPKLPSETYAPWLRNSNLTAEAFQEEILKLRANLRKAGRDDLLEKDAANSNGGDSRERDNESWSWNSRREQSNDRETSPWRRTGYQSRSSPMTSNRPHQFVAPPSDEERMELQRTLNDRRRGILTGIHPQ